MSICLDFKWNSGWTDCRQSCVLVTASGQHPQMLLFIPEFTSASTWSSLSTAVVCICTTFQHSNHPYTSILAPDVVSCRFLTELKSSRSAVFPGLALLLNSPLFHSVPAFAALISAVQCYCMVLFVLLEFLLWPSLYQFPPHSTPFNVLHNKCVQYFSFKLYLIVSHRNRGNAGIKFCRQHFCVENLAAGCFGSHLSRCVRHHKQKHCRLEVVLHNLKQIFSFLSVRCSLNDPIYKWTQSHI